MCIFCSENFPLKYQLIKEFENWFFVCDINPMKKFHCLLVFKNHIFWFDEIENTQVLNDFWKILNSCMLAIKNSDKNIKMVSISSLNLWENSKHLHFHLIPISYDDNIKVINDFLKDGWWLYFLWSKEIIQDCYKNYLTDIIWEKSRNILDNIDTTLKENIIKNVKTLKNNLYYEWF